MPRPQTAHHPRWSPDGKRIVFSARNPGKDDDDVYLAEPGVPGNGVVVRGPSDDVDPTFTADGSIAFASTRETVTNHDLWMGNMSLMRITATPENERYAAFASKSPGKTKGAWVKLGGGTRKLIVGDVYGGYYEAMVLSGVPGLAHPTWSRDEKQIVHEATSAQQTVLDRMDLTTGAPPTCVATVDGSNPTPRWGF